MINYHEELPTLHYGKLLKLHEGCITIKSNSESDTIWEQNESKNSIIIILTDNEAENVIDWNICTGGRSRFLRLFSYSRHSEHIDRKILDVSLYQLEGMEKYILQITWRPEHLGRNADFVICSSCGDPFDNEYVDRKYTEPICPWCKPGRN